MSSEKKAKIQKKNQAAYGVGILLAYMSPLISTVAQAHYLVFVPTHRYDSSETIKPLQEEKKRKVDSARWSIVNLSSHRRRLQVNATVIPTVTRA
jgi:hypothetical protein